MNSKSGKLVVIEGSDGSGKTTQLELLKNYLQEQSVPFNSMKFPQYETSFFGKTIKSFLNGELGDLSTANPYLLSVLYAMDRESAKEKLDEWLKNGKIVALDRYATSNMAHQYSRLPEIEKEKFLEWLIELEYNVNKIPKEDLVIFLHVPYQVSQELLSGDKRGDMVEKNEQYLKQSEEAYVTLAKKFPHWVTVECVNSEGTMRSKEEIHEEIVKILKEKNIV